MKAQPRETKAAGADTKATVTKWSGKPETTQQPTKPDYSANSPNRIEK